MADVACDGSGNIPVMDIVDSLNSKVDRAGDTMTGHLTLPGGGLGLEALQADEINTLISDALIGADSGIKIDPTGKYITKDDDSWIINQCAGWATVIGNTSPPTITDSFNFVSVTNTGAGRFRLDFESPMDGVNLVVAGSAHDRTFLLDRVPTTGGFIEIKIENHAGDLINPAYFSVVVYGRKI